MQSRPVRDRSEGQVSHAIPASAGLPAWPASRPIARPGAGQARALVAGLVLAAAAAGFAGAVSPASGAAIANAGPDLTRLLRGMALLKAVFAGAATAATLWRLDAPVTWPRLAAYAAGCAAMAAGPGLIWSMAHVPAGALLLHGGLLATALMLWRDPATAARLDTALAARRAGSGAGPAHVRQRERHEPVETMIASR